MNKSIFEITFKVLVVAGLVTLIALQFYKQNNIVYVDAPKLFKGYQGMEGARMQFEANVYTWKANLDSLNTELQQAINELEQKGSKLSAKEKALMTELVAAKQKEFQNYQAVVNEKIQKESQAVGEQALNKVNAFIKKYGEEHGYDIILAATEYGNIVYAKKGKDITDEILAGLNQQGVQ